jgi:hypothetical protein
MASANRSRFARFGCPVAIEYGETGEAAPISTLRIVENGRLPETSGPRGNMNGCAQMSLQMGYQLAHPSRPKPDMLTNRFEGSGKLRNRPDWLGSPNRQNSKRISGKNSDSASATGSLKVQVKGLLEVGIGLYPKSLTIGRSYVPAHSRARASGTHIPRDC